ncbi:MAG: magnesium/cobalt transporter CorA [Neisseria sp.]|nr:magnesium/cobalt transporter CorA [Neisseria sp.]
MINTPNPRRSNTDKANKHALYQTICQQQTCQQNAFKLQANQTLQSADGKAFTPTMPSADSTQWLHFVGINDGELLKKTLAPYGIHELVLEDLLSPKQRPKLEDYGDYLFIAARVYQYTGNKLQSDPVYLIIGKQSIFTFQSKPLGLFSTMREQFSQSLAQGRQPSIEWLAYAFLDRIIDDFFITLESYNNRVENLDKQLFNENNDADSDLLMRIHKLKRDAIRLQRALQPLKDIINQLLRGNFAVFHGEPHLYLRDAYDHILQLSDSLEASRDSVVGMMDMLLSFQSNKLNKQMRMLTVITIIFMPLTLLTGIYGMNFEYMPELQWRYGYFALLTLMFSIIVALLVFFYRRKWL